MNMIMNTQASMMMMNEGVEQSTTTNARTVTMPIAASSKMDDKNDGNNNNNNNNNSCRKQYCYELEAAVALNNMGLIMIRKGCISQACDTLQSAVVSIGACVTKNNSNSNNSKQDGHNVDYSHRCKVYERVKAAIEYAMNPVPMCNPTVFALTCRFVSSHWETSLPSSKTINDSNNDNMNAFLMMMNQQHQQFQQQPPIVSLSQEHPLPCYTFVRIDGDSTCTDESSHNYRNLCDSNQLVSAMILYNFAVASFIYFNNSNVHVDWSGYDRVQRRLDTVGLLSNALQILNDHCQDDCLLSSSSSSTSSSESASSPFFYSRVLFLKATIYHKLQLIMEALDQPDRAVTCLKHLIHMRALFCLWNDNYNYYNEQQHHQLTNPKSVSVAA